MDIREGETPVPTLIVDNFFTEDELTQVMAEMDAVRSANLLLPPERTGTATYPDGSPMKKNSGVFLDELYENNRDGSKCLLHTRKALQDDSIRTAVASHSSWFFRDVLPHTNSDHTLLTYYEHGGHYRPHRDNFEFTVLIWLFKEPRSFDGGRFILADYNHEIELVSNRAVYFPSRCAHEVTRVKMKDEFLGQGLGRYTLSIFVKSF